MATVDWDHVWVPTYYASLFTVSAYLMASYVAPRVNVTFSSPGVGAVNSASGSVADAPPDARPLRWFLLFLPMFSFTGLYRNNVDETISHTDYAQGL